MDTFLGGGTSTIACKNTNRKFRGCEISSEYYDKINEILDKAQEAITISSKITKLKKTGYIQPSKTNSHGTPIKLYEELNKEFCFDNFDPCPLNENPKFNGLDIEWANTTFVNPPYSDLKTTKKQLGWVEKAHNEALLGKTIVLLIPSRTDTQWYHEIILKNNYEVRFLKGRLKFLDNDGKEQNPASFSSMLVIMK